MIKSLVNYLRNELAGILDEVKVEKIHVGPVYTGVKLTTGDGGVAYTPVHELTDCCLEIPEAGEIAGNPAAQIMRKAESQNLVEAAIGVATLNALSQLAFKTNPEKYKCTDIDVLDLIQPGDKVVLVGYFKPLVPQILKKTGNVHVLEKREIRDTNVKVYPSHKAPQVIPSADIVLVSGSTLINKTVNQIIKLSQNARETVLLGPTASTVPQPWFKKGVTAVMGVKITDAETMLKVVSEGGGTQRLLSKCAEKTAFLNTTQIN
ncbi:MAG: Rossmann-like domain-containing protein [Candidatus Odinarchaeia archaeon]